MGAQTLDIERSPGNRIGESIPAIGVAVVLVLIQLYVFRWQAVVAIAISAVVVGILSYAIRRPKRTITIDREQGLVTIQESGFAGTRLGEKASRCGVADVQKIVLEDHWRGGKDVVRVVLRTKDGRTVRLTSAEVERHSGQETAERVRSFLGVEAAIVAE